MIHGPDLSTYQQRIDYGALRATSDFAIVKVTEGNSATNPRAEEQALSCAKAGLLVMLYHFARPNGPDWKADAAQEAARLHEIADSIEQKVGYRLFCFLDLERNSPLNPEERTDWRTWANEFRRWNGEQASRAIGFYSGKYFTLDLGFDSSWSETLLWLAQYPATFRADANYGFWPTQIAPWRRADIWQHGGGDPPPYGNASRCPGVEGPCDFNSFAGSRDELLELIASAR